VAVAEFETPRLKEYPVIPILQAGAMAHSRPFVAAAPIQTAIQPAGASCRDATHAAGKAMTPMPTMPACPASP